jgi:hypothetical protein
MIEAAANNVSGLGDLPGFGRLTTASCSFANLLGLAPAFVAKLVRACPRQKNLFSSAASPHHAGAH